MNTYIIAESNGHFLKKYFAITGSICRKSPESKTNESPINSKLLLRSNSVQSDASNIVFIRHSTFLPND